MVSSIDYEVNSLDKEGTRKGHGTRSINALWNRVSLSLYKVKYLPNP